MKLDSIVPNAHYDNEHGQPKVIEKDNDGSFLYRYNIKPEMKIPEGEEEEKQVGFSCCEIRVWEHPTKPVLKKAIIRSVIDETAEFDLVNSYNAAQEGMLDEAEAARAIADYRAYLRRVQEIKTNAKADLAAAGYTD